MMKKQKHFILLILTATTTWLTGCDKGGGGSSDNSANTCPSASVSSANYYRNGICYGPAGQQLALACCPDYAAYNTADPYYQNNRYYDGYGSRGYPPGQTRAPYYDPYSPSAYYRYDYGSMRGAVPPYYGPPQGRSGVNVGFSMFWGDPCYRPDGYGNVFYRCRP